MNRRGNARLDAIGFDLIQVMILDPFIHSQQRSNLIRIELIPMLFEIVRDGDLDDIRSATQVIGRIEAAESSIRFEQMSNEDQKRFVGCAFGMV
jgi:hypothetical protein